MKRLFVISLVIVVGVTIIVISCLMSGSGSLGKIWHTITGWAIHKPVEVQTVVEDSIPTHIQNKKFGLWENNLDWQRELITIFKIGGKKSGDRRLQFLKPVDLAVDSSGLIYVLDYSYGRVTVLSPSGQFLRAIYLRADSETPFQEPTIIATGPNLSLYVYDSSRRIFVMSSGGEELNRIEINYRAYDIAVDGKGNIFVLTPDEEFRIHKLNSNGIEVLAFSKNKDADRQLWGVYGRGRLAIGMDGGVYYSFEYPYRIIKYDSLGHTLFSFSRALNALFTPPTVHRDNKGRVISVNRQQMSWDIKVASDGMVYNLTRLRGAKGGDVLDVFNTRGEYLQSFHLNRTVSCFDVGENADIVFLLPRPLRRVEKYRISAMSKRF